MQDAIIVGGGIAGLTAGYLLQEKGLDISVVEKRQQPGGRIQSGSYDGFIYEKGPDSIDVSDPWIDEFVANLGLNSDVLEAGSKTEKQYVARSGRLLAMPTTAWEAMMQRYVLFFILVLFVTCTGAETLKGRIAVVSSHNPSRSVRSRISRSIQGHAST